MSIKALAMELYKAQQRVHKLQTQLETAALMEKDVLRHELKQAEAERNQLRRFIEAKKEPSPFQDNFSNR